MMLQPLHHLSAVDASLVLRAYYVLASAAILVASSVPALNSRFLAYGSRSQPSSSIKKENARNVERFLDHLATYQVPHSYFIHFYILSVGASVLWAWQFSSSGFLFTFLAQHSPRNGSDPSSTVLCWTLMLFQGTRRLYESLAFRTQSKSQMWIFQYFFGISFYLATSISSWIEGAQSLVNSSVSAASVTRFASARWASIALFLMASYVQHMAHAELYRLRTKGIAKGKDAYSLPQHPLFKYTLTPHYMAECFIYLSLAVVAAPTPSLFNGTILAALLLVAVNLGVTAAGTKLWYMNRFGEDAGRGRARMVPWIW